VSWLLWSDQAFAGTENAGSFAWCGFAQSGCTCKRRALRHEVSSANRQAIRRNGGQRRRGDYAPGLVVFELVVVVVVVVVGSVVVVVGLVGVVVVVVGVVVLVAVVVGFFGVVVVGFFGLVVGVVLWFFGGLVLARVLARVDGVVFFGLAADGGAAGSGVAARIL
jgi:hypothetical protein